MACVLVGLTLTGCAASGSKEPVQTTLAPVPADMHECFSNMVPKPRGGDISKAQAYAIIAKLKRSELEKSLCGKRLIQFYEAQQGPLQQ
jgi:hypothetical protein